MVQCDDPGISVLFLFFQLLTLLPFSRALTPTSEASADSVVHQPAGSPEDFGFRHDFVSSSFHASQLEMDSQSPFDSHTDDAMATKDEGNYKHPLLFDPASVAQRPNHPFNEASMEMPSHDTTSPVQCMHLIFSLIG